MMDLTAQAKTYPSGGNMLGLPQKIKGGFNNIISIEDIPVTLSAGAAADYTITSQYSELTQLDIVFLPTTKGIGGNFKFIPSPSGVGDASVYSNSSSTASINVILNANKTVRVISAGSSATPVAGILRIIVNNRKLKNYYSQAIVGSAGNTIFLPFTIADPKKVWLAPLSNFDGAFGLWVNSYLPQDLFPNLYHFTFGANNSMATKLIDSNKLTYFTATSYTFQVMEFY